MKIDTVWLKSFILSVAKPLKSVSFVSQPNDTTAVCDGLVPDGGQSPKFKLTSPFGIASGITKGCAIFYDALYGSQFESIILGMVHAARPPVVPGGLVLYSTDAAGNIIKFKIKLNPNGTVFIGRSDSPTEPLVLGNQLMAALGTLIDKFTLALQNAIDGPVGVGNIGADVPLHPTLIAEFEQIQDDLADLKDQYITQPTTNIVSQVAFTER